METELRAYGHTASESPERVRSILGSLSGVEMRQALIARGYGYHASIGAFSTPITGGGAGTILDLDQPEGVVSIPAGVAVLPVRIHIQLQVPLLAADSDETETMIAVDRANTWYGDGTFTEEEVYNLRTDLGGNRTGGPVRVASAFSADMTTDGTNDPVLHMELGHAVQVGDVQGTAATVWQNQLQLLYEPINAPIIVGPAAMYLYWGGTVATTGFAQIQFCAVPSGWFRLLT